MTAGRYRHDGGKSGGLPRLAKRFGTAIAQLAVVVFSPCPHRAVVLNRHGKAVAGRHVSSPFQPRHAHRRPRMVAVDPKLTGTIPAPGPDAAVRLQRSEEHTSELQSLRHL